MSSFMGTQEIYKVCDKTSWISWPVMAPVITSLASSVATANPGFRQLYYRCFVGCACCIFVNAHNLFDEMSLRTTLTHLRIRGLFQLLRLRSNPCSMSALCLRSIVVGSPRSHETVGLGLKLMSTGGVGNGRIDDQSSSSQAAPAPIHFTLPSPFPFYFHLSLKRSKWIRKVNTCYGWYYDQFKPKNDKILKI